MQLSQLKSDHTWRSAIGMSEEKFWQLAPLFDQAYKSEYEVYIATKQ